MRQIKFRAWNNHDKIMNFWDVLTLPLAHLEGKISPSQIMQFTGLTDRNGKDIYEQDIVSWMTEPVNDVVGFKDGTFMIGDVCSFNIPCSNLEVIGNIYENPELLK